jgi:hypothetical protein
MSKAIVTHGWSVASLQGVAFELKIMKSVLSRAMKAGRIEKNPAVDGELPSGAPAVREVFEAEHVRTLLLACKIHKRGRDWRGAILTAFYTGARLWRRGESEMEQR